MFKKLKNAKDKITQSPDFSDISSNPIRGFMGGEILNSKLVRKQAKMLGLLVLISFFYIGNRYAFENNLAKIDRLQRKLTHVKYVYLTISCDLMTLSRQSKVQESIKDRGILLEESTIPPYTLKAP